MTQQREKRLLNEWLTLYHRNTLQWRNVRLGPYATSSEARMFMVKLPHCDAIYIEDDVVHIVEAKIKPTPGIISQLEYYGRLFPTTPEFSVYKDKKIQLVALVGIDDQNVAQMCNEKNIQYIVFTPSWLTDYLFMLEKKRESKGGE